jgi:hypothetical protein
MTAPAEMKERGWLKYQLTLDPEFIMGLCVQWIFVPW